MKYINLHIVFFTLLSLFMVGNADAQHISFGLYATDGITLTNTGAVNELNFNAKQTVILSGNTVSIPNQLDNLAVVFAITGRADLDITVTIDADAVLYLDAENEIPFSVGFAYSNQGAGDIGLARTQALPVPGGFTSATFPLLKRASGPPGPPPTPAYNGVSYPTGTAYLFIFGSMGPVPTGAAAGHYQGNIDIRVEYSTYN